MMWALSYFHFTHEGVEFAQDHKASSGAIIQAQEGAPERTALIIELTGRNRG